MGILNKLCVSIIQRLLSRNYCIQLFAGVRRSCQANQWWAGTPLLLAPQLVLQLLKGWWGPKKEVTVGTGQSDAPSPVASGGERVCSLTFS